MPQIPSKYIDFQMAQRCIRLEEEIGLLRDTIKAYVSSREDMQDKLLITEKTLKFSQEANDRLKDEQELDHAVMDEIDAKLTNAESALELCTRANRKLREKLVQAASDLEVEQETVVYLQRALLVERELADSDERQRKVLADKNIALEGENLALRNQVKRYENYFTNLQPEDRETLLNMVNLCIWGHNQSTQRGGNHVYPCLMKYVDGAVVYAFSDVQGTLLLPSAEYQGKFGDLVNVKGSGTGCMKQWHTNGWVKLERKLLLCLMNKNL